MGVRRCRASAAAGVREVVACRRALLQVPDSRAQPRRRSSARRHRLLLFIARVSVPSTKSVRLGGRSSVDCSSESAARPPRVARRQLTAAAPALTLAGAPARGG
ncbi:unnamed protein product [Arctia plantaginis]|uniref:Uncharacterized protein n=1 Tax=Arctia plantaginis TaxID=874455 RepID=A0A8S0YSC5_ARCPL|nr:unnamed protein product [Arctia plantaginis]